MKKLKVILIPLLGVLLGIIFITCPYEQKYNIDQPYGMKNIMNKINDLAGNSSVYKIIISSQPEQGDMDFLTLAVIDPDNNHREIKFNRSGAFFNSTDDKLLIIKGKQNIFDISNLFSQGLTLIGGCKRLIPEGYTYRHTEYISVNNGRIASIKIAVAPQDENNIRTDQHVHQKSYSKESYTSGRADRRTKKNSITYTYYIMAFEIDKNGKIRIE